MKKIYLLIVILILCGCEAEYNIKIDSRVNDELIINAKDASTGVIIKKEMIQQNYDIFNLATDYNTPGYPEYMEKLEGYNYYSKELIDNNDVYGLKFKYSFNYDDYYLSYILMPFNDRNIKSGKNYLLIDSGNGNSNALFKTYPNLDKLTVNIYTDYSVNVQNADAVDGNKYTWIFTRDNYQNKELLIEIDRSTKKSKIDREMTNKIENIVLVSLGGIAIIGLLFVVIKVKISNN